MQMNNYYNLLPSTDVRKDEESIFEVLSAIKDDKIENDLKLLNYYREVPINFGASVDSIERGMVEMTVHQLQAALMGQQKETLIRSGHFSHDVIAKVSKAESEKRFAFLTSFSYIQILSDRRKHIRVEVTENIEVFFRSNNLELQGKLQDISLGGLAITAPEKERLDENIKGKVSFSLKGNRIEIPGVLLRILEDPPHKRLVFQNTPDSKSEEVISHFVFQTQSEIIRELKEKIL
jgi:hypothetical protein